MKGDGIGETITYYFNNDWPRVNRIGIYNGYSKNDRTWRNNSRVKEFLVRINGVPYSILELQDTWKQQWFEFPTLLGHFPDKDVKQEYSDAYKGEIDYWTLTLEILSVYKGDKYSDTAISAIEFDGIGVHCIVTGSEVLMADGATKLIEQLRVGDVVAQPCGGGDVVAEIRTIKHDNIVTLTTEHGNSISLTDDHPVQLIDKGWCSARPDLSAQSYAMFAPFAEYCIGDNIRIIKSIGVEVATKLGAIQHQEQSVETYMVRLKSGNSLIVSGFVVGAGF